MRGFGFIPEWDAGPTRTNKHAYFPVSLSATLRESTFSETLSGILGADPSHSPGDLKDAMASLDILEGDQETAEELWEAFTASYSRASSTYGSSAQEGNYIIPFHRSVATAIEVEQGRRWYRLYWLLMTDECNTVDKELHDQLVEALFDLQPSNILEEVVVEAILELEDADHADNLEDALNGEVYNPILPLVPECGEAFRKDIRSWLKLKDAESTSRWMRGLQDILCFYYMMYVIQVALTLDEEYENVEEGPPFDHSFNLQEVYFGLANETASQSRQFATEWKNDGISRALYDSWGRLAVLSHIVDLGLAENSPVESKPYTLTDALNTFPDSLQEKVVEDLLDQFPEDQRPEEDYGLAEAAVKYSHSVRRYYENMGKTRTSQTAYSAGENSVIDLGKGAERQFIETRKGVGTILRLDRAGLRLFARLFDATRERGHIDEFWRYMRRRGIEFDRRSRQEIIDQLEGMGLLQKQSDSGEAMYVETV